MTTPSTDSPLDIIEKALLISLDTTHRSKGCDGDCPSHLALAALSELRKLVEGPSKLDRLIELDPDVDWKNLAQQVLDANDRVVALSTQVTDLESKLAQVEQAASAEVEELKHELETFHSGYEKSPPGKRLTEFRRMRQELDQAVASVEAHQEEHAATLAQVEELKQVSAEKTEAMNLVALDASDLRAQVEELKALLDRALGYVSCCGYRHENPSAFPHVTGCPLGEAHRTFLSSTKENPTEGENA